MRIRSIHPWDLSVAEAIALQASLSGRIVPKGSASEARWVAACDAAYAHNAGILIGGAILWDRRQGLVVQEETAELPIAFPYVPGLLAFREAPVLLAALERLETKPDVLLVDGHGLAHPRRMGLASHMGLHVHVPTVGCAKSRLVGEHADLGGECGRYVWLIHRGRRVGAVVRTRTNVRPVYVSPGHRISLESSVDVVLGLSGSFRVPEPLRRAHLLAERKKRDRLRH